MKVHVCDTIAGESEDSLDGKIRKLGRLPSRDFAFRLAERDPTKIPRQREKQFRSVSIGLCLRLSKACRASSIQQFIVAVCTGADITEDFIRGRCNDKWLLMIAHPQSLAMWNISIFMQSPLQQSVNVEIKIGNKISSNREVFCQKRLYNTRFYSITTKDDFLSSMMPRSSVLLLLLLLLFACKPLKKFPKAFESNVVPRERCLDKYKN